MTNEGAGLGKFGFPCGGSINSYTSHTYTHAPEFTVSLSRAYMIQTMATTKRGTVHEINTRAGYFSSSEAKQPTPSQGISG